MSKDDKLKTIEIEEEENKKLFEKLIDNNDNVMKKLEEEYNDYKDNLKEIYPGNKLTRDIYCKLIALIQNKNDNLLNPEEQNERVKKILKDFFTKEDDIPKIMKLYPDTLQYKGMKDLEFRNKPEQVKDDLTNFYIQKYFRLNNIREKILTKANQILNFKDFNEKFQINKDYKIGKINTELDLTLKRIIRLLNKEDKTTKDFEYYLKHFKVKRIDSIFLKKEQDTIHYSLRKDDFEVYFREKTYRNKIALHLKAFKPNITYCPIKNGMEIYKNSKIVLNNIFKKSYENQIKTIKSIYKSEKQRCASNDIKLFKDYFKAKYTFYYRMKNEYEGEKTKYNFTYDIFYPPLVISLNSEIRPYLKELCEYFNIPFDLSIDKGRAFSYSINVFYPGYFNQQTKNFKFNSYELTFNEIISGELKSNENADINLETKTTEILRNKYDVQKGFLVNGDNKFLNDSLKHTSFKSDVYIKSAHWTICICLYPEIDIKYIHQMRILNEIGYVDSNFKYILEIIEKVDLSTLNRLVEDYTMNTSNKIKSTIKLISSKKEENEYSQLRELVAEIIENDDAQKGNKIKSSLLNPHDEYTDRIDSDLLKYLMTLRFLKLRDFKFYILNLLNYFRYVQKRIVIDSYKIENRTWKKNEDLNNLTEILSRTIPNEHNVPKNLIVTQPLSEFSKTNPIIPSLERIIDSKKNDDPYNKSYFEEIDEYVEYSDKLIRIKDAKGNYIIYEATLSDMKQLEDEFCKIGTYYIQKKEKLIVDTDKVPNPFIDRTQVILDLFLSEFDYLYAKFEFVSELMTIYDNTTDIYQQKHLMKQITNVMAKRPILDLNYHYFTASYMIEVELLRKKAAFIHILIDYQKKMEINENKQLYDTIDKYYWLLGESALEIIQHVRFDRNDIELIKQVMEIKKQKKLKDMSDEEKEAFKEIDDFIELFTKLQEEKKLENELNLELDNNSKILNFDDSNKNDSINSDKSDSKQEEKKNEKVKEMNFKIQTLLRYLRKLFSIALTGGDDNFLDNKTEDLIRSEDEITQSLKESLLQSINESEAEKKKKPQNNYSYSISNTSLDLLNYQIRSLLNIPNPFLENKHLDYIEKNPQVISSLNKEINFIRFEEGFPHKFFEQDDPNSKGNEIEFFESLSEISDIYDLIKQATSVFMDQFIFENSISSEGLEISLFDYLIEEWENFKDYISGKKSSTEFEKLYYLQNTIIDNYHSFIYSLKNLTAILSSPIDRIPPEIFVYLPNQLLERSDFENIEFIKQAEPKDPTQIENLILEDLEKSLINILMNDFKSGWVDFKNQVDELQIYCNAIEVTRMKQLVFNLIVKNTLLSGIYEKQKKDFLNTNENILTMRDTVGMIPYTDSDAKKNNYLERYNNEIKILRKKNHNIIPKFFIEEFDPSLVTCVFFKDMISVQTDFFENGLNELKTLSSYEYMNFYLLLIAIQHNYILFFDSQKYINELNLYKNQGIVVRTNPSFNVQAFINNPKTNKNEAAALHDLEKKVEEINNKLSRDYFYYINKKKIKNRSNILSRYNIFVESKVKFLKKPPIIKYICSRHERLLLINAYIQVINLEVFLDSINLQACKFSTHLRNLIKTIPKEYNIFEINEMNFLDNCKKTLESTTPNKNFWYFHDRSHPFNKFYIPSNLEILRLNERTDEDELYHYSKYNSFGFNEEVLNPKFFYQFKDFYRSPILCNRLEDSRNKFFEQAFSYQSNIFLFLKLCSFFLNFINLKFIDICLTQNPMEIIDIISQVDKGDDFWGDKKINLPQFDEEKRIPLNIVEKIIDTQKNYLNLRINFDRMKIDLEEVVRNLQKYLESPKKLVKYIDQNLNYRIYHWYHIFNIARELSLKKDDINAFEFLSKLIRDNFLYGKRDYFKSVDCLFECHIEENELYNKYYNDLFYQYMHYEDNNLKLFKLKDTNYFPPDNNFALIQTQNLLFNDNIKYFFPFISENKIAEVRNLNFKITSMTKNYLIYIEKSSLNSDLIDLDIEKINFLKYYIKLTEFKYKFMILCDSNYIPITSKKFDLVEKYIKSYHNRINLDWIEKSSTSDPNDIEDEDKQNSDDESSSSENEKEEDEIKVKRKNEKKITKKIDKVFDNKRENNLKMKNSIIVETFLKEANNNLNAFYIEVRYKIMMKAINCFQKENNAFKELFSSERNDLDINHFKNKFSSNFLQLLDDNQLDNINRKFPFFESFINKIKNICLEVETHTNSNAILISRTEYEDAIKVMIRDFIIYDTNMNRSNHFSQSSEKFGYFFSIKKLEIWLKAYKNKLIEFDQDLEKISNAKIAITNNSLVYEMDNLYRQLKVLKDNIKIMEIYIRDYFQDKFKNLILSFKTEMSQIEAKFQEFRNDLVIKTNQKITEEYNHCINELKQKTIFITETVNKISNVDTTQEKEFFENFYRGLAMNQNYHIELNKKRKHIEDLQNEIAHLHEYYKNELHKQKIEFENELDKLRKNLSNNKDLWDKLAIAERNENILKEELSKTQKSLASAEEFIKRLRIQIRNSHDKNVSLEKKISQITVKDIINNAGKGTNLKAMELYGDIRQNYVYNMKNNVNIITAIERIKARYDSDEDIKVILANFEMLHKKYSEEVDNKRNFANTLINIKEDIERMQTLHNKKLDEYSRSNAQLKDENNNLKMEIEKLKMKYGLNNSNSNTVRKSVKSINLGQSVNMSKSSVDKFPQINSSKKMNTEEKKAHK